jgi:hypothetical protein
MPKRCETVNNGEPCNYLASDGSCLLSLQDMPEKCPARETIGHEEKDEWMTRKRKGRTKGGIGTVSLEDV